MNRIQTLATVLVGVWIGWTLFMWFLAGRSFSTVARILRKPGRGLSEHLTPPQPEENRLVFRHVASEINRTIFRAYGFTQIVLGVLVFFLLYKQFPRDVFSVVLAGCMIGLVLILALVVTPLVTSLGRSLDFLPRDPPPPGLQKFWKLHGAFTALDGLKLLAALVLVARWILKI